MADPVAPVESAVAVGRSLGLPVERAVVLRESLNLIVHLAPSPVIARVALLTARVREIEPLADSLGLARHLLAAGVPVTPPATEIDPGPHVGPGGWRMTLWQHLRVEASDPDPADAGRTLRAVHEAAAAYAGPMRHVGPAEEARRLITAFRDALPDEAAFLSSALEALALPDRGIQPLHGDAHLNNVMVTPGGQVWGDWEESWRGPVEWDLACLEHRRRVFGELDEPIETALAAYGPYDEDAVAAYGELVTVWAAAWGVLIAADSGQLGDGTRRRLGWLSGRR